MSITFLNLILVVVALLIPGSLFVQGVLKGLHSGLIELSINLKSGKMEIRGVSKPD